MVLGGNEEVFGNSVCADQLTFMSVPDLEGEMEVTAQIRYSHKGAPCTIRKVERDKALCEFTEPVRAITPGQAVVFYQGDLVVGGGCIL